MEKKTFSKCKKIEVNVSINSILNLLKLVNSDELKNYKKPLKVSHKAKIIALTI